MVKYLIFFLCKKSKYIYLINFIYKDPKSMFWKYQLQIFYGSHTANFESILLVEIIDTLNHLKLVIQITYMQLWVLLN